MNRPANPPCCVRVLLLSLALILSASSGVAQPRVIPVPFDPGNPSIPHPAYEGHRTTLKAIVRDASQNTYTIDWDFEGDGVWDESFVRNRDSTGDVRDIGVAITVPNVDGDTLLMPIVRATSGPDVHFATYPLFVYDSTPSPDPTTWSVMEREIMRQNAVSEMMWYLHRRMNLLQGLNSSSTIRGWFSNTTPDRYGVTALFLYALCQEGRYPAYPPGTVNPYTVGLPPGWAAANDFRWNTDPYAEDAARLLNGLVNTAQAANIPASDEPADGMMRIPGTSNTSGIYLNTGGGEPFSTFNGYNGMHLAAVASALPHMVDTPVQLGGATGQSYQWLVQEMVDYVGYQQLDPGSTGHGGWYPFNGRQQGTYAESSIYMETTIRAGLGLATAHVEGTPYGVIVGRNHRFAVANALTQLQVPPGGVEYFGGEGTANLLPVGGALALCRWLGMDQMSPIDPGTPFAPHVTLTAGQMRAVYDNYLGYAASQWGQTGRTGSLGLADSLWQTGDYRCGDTTTLFGAPPLGSSWGAMWFAVGLGWPGSDPSSTLVRDWESEIPPYVARSLTRGSNYAEFGELQQGYAPGSSRTGANAVPDWSTACALIAASVPEDVLPPAAVADVFPQTVTEACSGAGGMVNLSAMNSFHFDPVRTLTLIEWDIDDSDGLAWDSMQPADYSTSDILATPVHTYQFAGLYTITMRLTDDLGQHAMATAVVEVQPMGAIAPVADSGGPYEMLEGADLLLDASGSYDFNVPCGDSIVSYAWDLDGDGSYNGADDVTIAGSQYAVPWEDLASVLNYPADPTGLPTNNISVRVMDSTGRTDTAATTITIYSPDPLITGQSPLTTEEETELTLSLGDLQVFDFDSPFPNGFTLSVMDGANYLRSGNAVTPAVDFAGDLTVPVTVSDGLHTSDPFGVLVAVTNVNDAPELDPIGNKTATEDVLLTILCTASDARDNPPNDMVFTIDGTAQGNGMSITAGGEFSWTPDGTHAGNTYPVTITVTDDGSPPESDSETIQIMVMPATGVKGWELMW